MDVIWNSDTGTGAEVVIVATETNEDTGVVAPVNFTGSTEHTFITKARVEDAVAAALSVTITDAPNGKFTVDAGPLDVGTYDGVLRFTNSDGDVLTYPSPELPPLVINVKADLDAV